jgi:penicillin-binding protein 3
MRKLIMFLLLIVVLTGCNQEPSPEDRFAEYIKLWNDQKFAQMYDAYLSVEAKKEITKEKFIERYTKIYKDLEVTKLKVQYAKPKEPEKTKETSKKLPFAVKMNTVAGPIEFDQNAKLVKEKQDNKENWYLTWNYGFIFPKLTKNDKINFVTVPANRGEIHDRHGDPLAINGRAFEIGIVPEKMVAQEQTVSQVAALLQISQEKINKALSASWVKPSFFVPITKIAETETELLAKLYAVPGVDKKNVNARVYPFKESAAHLIGYTGPITAAELEKLGSDGYLSTDMIGKRGLEQVLDKKLKGTNGIKITIKKPDGTELLLAEKLVEHGATVQLTIDGPLQQQIFAQLTGEAGASSAIDPITGETLALVSSPSFDPNKMSLGIPEAERKALEEHPQQPLLNRFKSTYAPGSVIKPITAAIGLTAGTLSPEQAVDIKGLTWSKDKSWGNYVITRVKDPNTPVNLEKALIYSDNIYFAQAALMLGKDKFTQGLKNFAFEEEIPYLYPLEPSKIGNMDSEIKVADSGYGQGQIEVNVLHMADMYTPFLNGGNVIKPILALEEQGAQILKEQVVNEEQARIISDSLLKNVEDPSGTAHSGQINGISYAGKTGTAELKLKQGEAGAELGWFVAYKTQSPHILVAMMVENVQNRGGSKIPVEKVKNILQNFGQ